MLVSALGATLVGFALLVLALATGTLWLAVACIVICVVGALLLLADTLGIRPQLPRRRRSSSPDAAPAPSDGDAPTEQFERITAETVVTLGDEEPADRGTTPAEAEAASARHGRHERPDLDDDAATDDTDGVAPAGDPPRRGRHGTPD